MSVLDRQRELFADERRLLDWALADPDVVELARKLDERRVHPTH